MPEAGQRGERVAVGRHAERGLDDRGVAEHLAGGDVAPLGDVVAHGPQLAHHGHLPTPPHLVHAGRAAPGVLAGRRGRRGGDGVELLAGPLELALPGELGLQRVAQVDQQLHVEGGVAQPGLGQRAGGPVDGGVALLQGVPEDVLDHRAEPHPGEAREPARELRVEESGRRHPYLAQARQVLGGGVQHPLGVADGLAEGGQVGAADGVDQRGAGAFAAQLDEVGALAVAVAGGPLGVHGDGPGARGEGRDDPGQGVGVGDDRGHALTRFQQGNRRRIDVVRGAAPGGSQCRVFCGLLGVGHWSRVSVDGKRPSPERSGDGRDAVSRGQWMMPVRRATATIPARSPVPSLRAMRARWLLTVRAESPIETPMALLDWPSATSRNTSTSRPESSR